MAASHEKLPPDVSLPVPRSLVGPYYPFKLREVGAAGGALFRLHINDKAKVTRIEAVRASHPEFSKAALQALQKWQFARPAMQNGKPIAVVLHQMVVFELDGRPSADWEWQVAPEPAFESFRVVGATIPVR